MKIFVSRKIPSLALSQFEKDGIELKISPYDRSLESSELIEQALGCDYLLTLLTDKIDGEVIDAIGPQLKGIANYAVGFDNINISDATVRGVVVTNTPCDEVNQAVAGHTWALILALSRRIVEADEATKRGAYKGWEPGIFLGSELTGKTLGIIGMGRIGSMVARKAKAFEMRVVYTKRTRDEKEEAETGAIFKSIEDLCSESDVISLHVPLTNETRHMINTDLLKKMKPGVMIVNTARGAIIREQDLVDELRAGRVSGAGLDVFDAEPNINPELIGMENVILTPHIGSATHESREKMGQVAVSSILGMISGSKPETIVNPEVWDNRRK